MRYLLAIVILFSLVSSAYAADIVTVPTANQLKQGQFDLAYYYIHLDNPPSAPDDGNHFDQLDESPGAPKNVQVQTAYVGLTDRIELDAHRYDIDKLGDATIINASFLLMKETLATPDIIVGARNIGGTDVGGVPNSDKRSWFVAAAKTLKLPQSGPPALPVIRLHAGLGTKDGTLLGEYRHNGLFGGVQVLLAPQVGAVALYDGQDLITGLTFSPKATGLTLKGGTFGDHWWVGLSWAK